jgi:hypothetical protein
MVEAVGTSVASVKFYRDYQCPRMLVTSTSFMWGLLRKSFRILHWWHKNWNERARLRQVCHLWWWICEKNCVLVLVFICTSGILSYLINAGKITIGTLWKTYVCLSIRCKWNALIFFTIWNVTFVLLINKYLDFIIIIIIWLCSPIRALASPYRVS